MDKQSYTVIVPVAYFGAKRLPEGATISLTERQARSLKDLGQLELTSVVEARRAAAAKPSRAKED